jgi:hypothetical protein
MKTPITDAVNTERYVDHLEGYCAMLNTARRLELDRAALMEAVANIDPYPEEEIEESRHGGNIYCEITFREMRAIRAALAAARANFPTE